VSVGTRALHEDLPRTTDLRSPRTWALRALAGTCRAIIGRWYDVQVTGAQHWPTRGPVIVAANHTGFIDGPLMAIYAPRPLHALTKREMFHGAMSPFLTQSGQIPVWRDQVDPYAVRTAVKVLRDGGCVGVFPEGTRGSGELLTTHGGAAYLALVTGAPVLPLVYLGTREPGSARSIPAKGTRVVMQYGEPVHLDRQPWPRHQSDVRRSAEQLRLVLRDLLAAAEERTGMTTPGPIPDPNPKEQT
jgi:1-acyl-sn-glycerol-3-phosphate acyltransferase